MKSQIMYIARCEHGGPTQWARIGRVRVSKTGQTVYYDGRELRGGSGYFTDVATGELFHVRAARSDGLDRSEGRKRGSFPVEIDHDVLEEYWQDVRAEPSQSRQQVIRS